MTQQIDSQVIDALLEIAKTSKKQEKKDLVIKYQNLPEFKRILQFLHDPFQKIGISTKKLNKELTSVKHDYSLSELLDYLLANPTGNTLSIGYVKHYINNQKPEYQELLATLFDKSLKIGMSSESLNSVFGESFIASSSNKELKKFKVQLAFPYEKKIHIYTDDDVFAVTQKLNGFRGIPIIKDGKCRIYSRQGKEIEGLNELCAHYEAYYKEHLQGLYPEGCVCDGELLLRTSENLSDNELFRATSKALRSNGTKVNIQHKLFDIIPIYDFLEQKTSSQIYSERREVLDNLPSTEFINVVQVIDYITKKDIPKYSQMATDNGWEGVMLNDVVAQYRKTRSPQLLKVKTMRTADLPIVGYNQADSGQFKGGLKSINVQLDKDNIVSVSTGMSEEDRKDIWNNRDKYLGTIVEIQYFEMTENEKGGKSLQFPVFKGFRPDKTIEDVNIE